MDMDGTVVIKCMSCARTFGRVKRNNGSYSETLALMGEAPGLTAQTTLERVEDIESSTKRRGAYARRSAPSVAIHQRTASVAIHQRTERRRFQDHALAEAVARRLGATLQDLRLASKRRDEQARVKEAITELHMLGLGAVRIGAVLGRQTSGISRRLARLKAENRTVLTSLHGSV
jgi:cell division septum initiation protein DivIVA